MEQKELTYRTDHFSTGFHSISFLTGQSESGYFDFPDLETFTLWRSGMPYTFWKETLRMDAEKQGKLREFNDLGDIVLHFFYERGCSPSVQSIIEDVENAA